MRDVIPAISAWFGQGQRVALATVIRTWGSAPRQVGAHMAVSQAGGIAGSVSGGCVESAVAAAALEVLQSHQPVLLKFGVADDQAWEVGLACGGEIHVFVQGLSQDAFQTISAKIEAGLTTQYAMTVEGTAEQKGRMRLLAEPVEPPVPHLRQTPSGEEFVNIVLPAPVLVLVGGVQIAIALSRIAATLGFETILIEPRRGFSDPARFPDVDQLVCAWPEEAFRQLRVHETTAIVTLTIDPKIDDPALRAALDSSAFYIGALGSKKVQAERLNGLRQSGFSPEQLERIHGPVGLNIGAKSPEEIALSIMAEITAVQHGRKALNW